ncbi:MAG: hypothetical protein ABI266_04715 [Ginsengibacter sp.]
MKKIIFFLLFITISFWAKSQSVDSIYVHLYTDSLKKGTYNYINIDGKLANGNYLPLDSTYLIFNSSDGKFSGNSLWVPINFEKNKISISVTLRTNKAIHKNFDIYIKQNPDPELKTENELMRDIKNKKRRS